LSPLPAIPATQAGARPSARQTFGNPNSSSRIYQRAPWLSDVWLPTQGWRLRSRLARTARPGQHQADIGGDSGHEGVTPVTPDTGRCGIKLLQGATMAVVIVNRFKGNHDHTSLVREGAAILKRHGAISVRAGRVFSGQYAGQLTVVTTLPDMAAFGRYAQALMADAQWQKFMAETSKVFELQDRSISVSEDF
jgi:hypothetical protein